MNCGAARNTVGILYVKNAKLFSTIHLHDLSIAGSVRRRPSAINVLGRIEIGLSEGNRSHIDKKRPTDLSIAKRLGGFY